MIEFIVVLVLWGVSTFSNGYLLRLIEGKKISLEELTAQSPYFFGIITALAPVVTILLCLAVIYKLSIEFANAQQYSRKGKKSTKDCKSCKNRVETECDIFKMNLRPEMMCRGSFYTRKKAAGRA